MAIDDKIHSYVNHFASIDRSRIVDLLSRARTRVYEKSDLFLREGDTCKEIMFVDKGGFRYFVTNDGDDFTKDFCLDSMNPFCTGFASFVMKAPSLINIEAIERSHVVVWEKEYIDQLFSTMPWIAFARRIAEILFVRKEKREISFLRDSAEERYRLFVAEFKEVLMRVPQYHIASYLGIKPESLSRIRRRVGR